MAGIGRPSYGASRLNEREGEGSCVIHCMCEPCFRLLMLSMCEPSESSRFSKLNAPHACLALSVESSRFNAPHAKHVRAF